MNKYGTNPRVGSCCGKRRLIPIASRTLILPPAGWTWNLPFNMVRDGENIQIDPEFNLQTYAGITVAKTQYVDRATGNNGNTGLSWAQALHDPTGAAANTDRLYIKAGTYMLSEIAVGNRSREFIGVEPGVRFTNFWDNYIGAWTHVGNHYVASVSGSTYTNTAVDQANADPNPAKWYGQPITAKASEAEVDATPNSFYYVYGGTSTFYLRTFDDRPPDANIHIYYSYAPSVTKDSLKFYFKNITMWNGRFQNNSATGGLKIYLEDCTLLPGGISSWGLDEMILKNCTSLFGGDVNNIDARNGIASKVIEIDCDFQNSSLVATDQASTGHNGCTIVRVNGKYHDVGGQCVADVLGCKTWMLGCQCYNSKTARIGFYTSGTMWLDSCQSDNGLYDLQNTAGSTIYIHNFFGKKGVNDIAGSLIGY